MSRFPRVWLLVFPLVLSTVLLAGGYVVVTSTPVSQPATETVSIQEPTASASPISALAFAATPTAASKPLPIKLTRGPYLQSVTHNGVTVVWETDVPFASQVDYGATDEYGLMASNSTPVTHHVVALAGLKPYSQLHYRLSVEGQALSKDFSFRTAALPDQPQFTFVVYGDTRSDLVAQSQVVRSILSLAPDFVLHTGDFVADGFDPLQWTDFLTVERDLLRQAPLFGVLGNHERNSPYYFDAFVFPGNERWYSFDYGNVHFVALEVDGYASYMTGSEQWLWLENDLAHTRQRWKVVFFHMPPYSSGAHGSKVEVRQALEPLFEQYGVDLVFNGHDHDYERSAANNIVYIVTAGGGAPLYPRVNSNPASVYFTSTHHAVLVTVTGSLLTVTAVRSDGIPFDEFRLSKTTVYLPLVLGPNLAADRTRVRFRGLRYTAE